MERVELASRTGLGESRLADLIVAGVLQPGPDGPFSEADINRIRIAESCMAYTSISEP